MNYNIIKLENLIKEILLESISKNIDVTDLLKDFMDEQDPSLLDETSKTKLSQYSKESIHLALEKLILLSLENKNQYWDTLKQRDEKQRTHILSHFYSNFIEDLKRSQMNIQNTDAMEEIKKIYNKKIENSFDILSEQLKTMINNSSSISLNHMQNLNANGRIINIKGTDKKIGGIFLNKNSNITYAQFVNKQDLLNSFRISKNKKEIILKNGTIQVYDFKRIVNSLTQTIKIEQGNQNQKQDTRILFDGDKKVGNLFLGNKGIDLENGTYISVEELTFALNKFMQTKSTPEVKKVVKRKNKLKQGAAVVALTTYILGGVSSKNSASQTLETPATVYQQEPKEDSILTLDNNLIFSNENMSATLETKPILKEQISAPAVLENVEELTPIENEEQEHIFIEEPVSESPQTLSETLESKEENVDLVPEMPEEQVEESQTVQTQESEEEKVEETPSEEVKNTDIEETEEVNSNQEIVTTSLEENEIGGNSIQSTEQETISEEVVQNAAEPLETNIINEETTSLEDISGQEIVDYAIQFVGNPYEYGGTDLNNGTDCSGFTKGVYAHFGIELPRTSSEQSYVGTDIGTNLEDAVPGDLLCYDGHIAIYMGNGEIVHASTEKGGIKIGLADYQKIVSIRRLVEENKKTLK
jgi:cell wall-associated NlpC family hydrolase